MQRLDNEAPELVGRAVLEREPEEVEAPPPGAREAIDALEVFEHIRDIQDPEHPYSLEQLGVVSLEGVEVDDAAGRAAVRVVPTVPHCSMATLIGLAIKAKLEQVLPPRFAVKVFIPEGAHSSADQVNKQLGDKERVCAALENPSIVGMVEKSLQPSY